MNRSDLSLAMASASGIPRMTAERALNAALAAMAEELTRGQRVTLAGFGTFKPVARKARIGRDPRTGTRLEIAPCNSVHFAVSPELRDALNLTVLRAHSAGA
ncbi:MAG: HU family DNA-binding protein [Acidobacteria bacterium]|nr:MAG: HU family DNA-binding protein [Acidobacteriota bacterium]